MSGKEREIHFVNKHSGSKVLKPPRTRNGVDEKEIPYDIGDVNIPASSLGNNSGNKSR